MKKIILGLCIGAITGLCGCTTSTTTNQNINLMHKQKELSSEYFEEILTDLRHDITILRDKYTNILYIEYHQGYGGGITIMMNADGTPMLYNEWLEIQNKR